MRPSNGGHSGLRSRPMLLWNCAALVTGFDFFADLTDGEALTGAVRAAVVSGNDLTSRS